MGSRPTGPVPLVERRRSPTRQRRWSQKPVSVGSNPSVAMEVWNSVLSVNGQENVTSSGAMTGCVSPYEGAKLRGYTDQRARSSSGRVREWMKRAGCNPAVRQGLGGSNPPPPIRVSPNAPLWLTAHETVAQRLERQDALPKLARAPGRWSRVIDSNREVAGSNPASLMNVNCMGEWSP